ncbi:MAG TPA: hypothetical protein VKZ79_11545 [Alphaproteobacteria bacterium]|nr:hypothetical protein [Alphaproteobacteria bacterium]
MAETAGITNEDRKQLQEYMRREFTGLLRVPARPLYHYTDGQAAADILDGCAFRATNILYLSDGREIQHAVDCFQEAMALRLERDRSERSLRLDALVSRYLSEVGQYVPPDVWLVTFTELRDSQRHWEALHSGGHGVALGFAPQALARAAETGGAFLAPCCYDDDIKIAIMGRGLDLIDRLYATKADRSPEVGINLARTVIRELALFGALMKRSDLADENEWRLIVVNAGQTPVGARRIKALARPLYTSLYIDLEIGDASDRLPLTEIIVGPSSYQQMTERAFRTLLYKYGYEQTDVLLTESG